MNGGYGETRAQRLVGVVFMAIGAAFLIAAVSVQFVVYGGLRLSPLLWDKAPFIVSFVFFQIGAPLLLVGAVFCIWVNMRRLRIKRLIELGDRITANIDDITQNMMVRVNRHFPYIILCSWQDPRSGVTYHFRSGNIWNNPASMIEEYGIKTVTVYVKRGNIKKYYVEVPGFSERDVYL